MAEKPVKPKGRSLSMIEWVLTLEREREAEPIGAGR